MHKKIALFSAVVVAMIPLAPTLAQIEGSIEEQPQNRQQMRTEVQTQRQNIKTEISETKERFQAVKAEAAQKRLEFQSKKEKMTQERCKNIEGKVANRINRYENNGQMLEKVYGNMKTRLERLLARLKTAGADTTQLEKDLQTLYAKIDKLKTDQATFIATLKDTQSFACGKSEGEFKTKINEARKVPANLKTDREDIKNFFQTTIKTDLQEIRTKLASQTQTQTQNQAAE